MSHHEEEIKKQLIKERAVIVAQLIHTMSRLLQNVIAREAPMSDLGVLVRASISAAYDTLKESIAEQEAEEKLEEYSRSKAEPVFADEEARTKFDRLVDLEQEIRFKRAVESLKPADELEPRVSNRKAREMKTMTSSGRRRVKLKSLRHKLKADR